MRFENLRFEDLKILRTTKAYNARAMKEIATIFLVLFATTLFGQTNLQTGKKSDFLLVVCKISQTVCGSKAIKVIGDTVLIDTCYNQKEKQFITAKKEVINSNPLYSKISNLTNSEWQKIERDIDKIDSCDFLVPIEITLKENGNIKFYSLKGIVNCYPESAKDIMESLRNYFDKMH